VLIRQHLETAPPAKLAGWLEARGLAYVVDRSWELATTPDPADHAFVVSLGHDRSARDTHVPAVAAEHELLRRAVERDVPVLGLCYGGQVLAAVLGGRVHRAAAPELGWLEAIDTDDPERVPTGPWLAWHFDTWTVPTGAQEVARTRDASQAFRCGHHLAVQFHPEATVDVVAAWARADAERLRARGIDDPQALLRAAPGMQAASDAAAVRLFDAFLAGVAADDLLRL
jgi:GMP synthase-like glutamine amidotransferase